MRSFDRRVFLKGAGAAFVAGLSVRGAEAAGEGDVILASACRFPGGGFGAVLFSENGRILRRVELADRGHDVVFSPSGETAVAFARRPGNFAMAFPVSGSGDPKPAIVSSTWRHSSVVSSPGAGSGIAVARQCLQASPQALVSSQ